MSELKSLIIILGPTASGKTGLALQLAKEFNGELINADSRQIYREMDIATNKIDVNEISREELKDETVYFIKDVPIYMLDLINPDKTFSLADYKKIALKKIYEIQNKDKLPILVGGTGLYISSITDNLEIPKAPANKSLRNELEQKDSADLFKVLQKLDPDSAESIGRNNKRKLIRALEVYKITGKPFSKSQIKGTPLFNILEIGIQIDRKELYEKIDKRVDQMIKSGIIEETKKLQEKYSSDLPAMTGIGYKEIGSYLRSEISLDEAIQQIKWHTHQYARRQITWFKRDNRIRWIKDYQEAKKLIEEFLK